MTETMHVTLGNDEFAVDVDDDELRIGEVAGPDVHWWHEPFPLDDLGGEARHALETGDAANPALAIALRGITTALRDRGA